MSCFNISNIKYNLIINFKFRNYNIFTISKLYLFNLNLDKLLTKKIAQNFDFFNNLINIFYIVTSFEYTIVKKKLNFLNLIVINSF